MKLTELKKLMRKAPDAIPADWKTSRQWAKEWHLSRDRAAKLLAEAASKKIVQRKKFRVSMEDSSEPTRLVWHYKFNNTGK